VAAVDRRAGSVLIVASTYNHCNCNSNRNSNSYYNYNCYSNNNYNYIYIYNSLAYLLLERIDS